MNDQLGRTWWRRLMEFEPSQKTAERNMVIGVVVSVALLFVGYLWSL